MKRCLLILVITLPIGAIAQTEPRDFLSLVLRPEAQVRCGLQKLSPSERSELGKVFDAAVRSNAMEEGAVEYLKSEGWEEIKVIGERELKLDEDADAEEYLVVERGAWTYILEPKTYSSLRPGRYLGDMGASSCDIIDSDGDVVSFWTADQQ